MQPSPDNATVPDPSFCCAFSNITTLLFRQKSKLLLNSDPLPSTLTPLWQTRRRIQAVMSRLLGLIFAAKLFAYTDDTAARASGLGSIKCCADWLRACHSTSPHLTIVFSWNFFLSLSILVREAKISKPDTLARCALF